jgi:predicted DNA-binding antitoxin AbrB/MazE fold protein
VSRQIEAVFEKGVFRPLRPVDLPEFQRATVLVPEPTEIADNDTSAPDSKEVGYEPLPLRECKTIRVKVKLAGDIALLPYPVDHAELEDHDELE